MAIVIQKKPETVEVTSAVAKTEVEIKNGKTSVKQTESEEHLEDVVSTEPLANIGVSAARTFNLGNYNSAKIQVSLHYPTTINDLDVTYEKVKNWVESKMEAIANEVSTEIGG